MKPIIVGSKDSELDIIQTELIINQLLLHNPDLVFERKRFQSAASEIHMQSMQCATQKEAAKRELENALLEGKIDIAVWSLKDMLLDMPKELSIAAFLEREDPRDVLLVRKGKTEPKAIEDMTIGTSSLRRKVQLECLYKGVKIKNIQGDINARIKMLKEGTYDGIVLAAAGVKRAGLTEYILKYFSEEEMIPAAGQGILAVQTGNKELCPLLKQINNETAEVEAIAERAYRKELAGGCKMASGVYACMKNSKLYLSGMFYSKKTKKCYKESVIGYKSEAEKLGIFFANYMKRRYGS